MTYDNTNRGALFRAKDKRSESHADYNGTINIDGKEYWLNGWLKTSKAGDKYFSLSVKPKLLSDRASPPTGGRHDPRPDTDAFDDSEIPF